MESRTCECSHRKVGRDRLCLDHDVALTTRLRICAMNLTTDTAVDWEALQAGFKNVWSVNALQRKWDDLKSKVDKFQEKTHQGLSSCVDMLYAHIEFIIRVDLEIVSDLVVRYSSPACQRVE